MLTSCSICKCSKNIMILLLEVKCIIYEVDIITNFEMISAHQICSHTMAVLFSNFGKGIDIAMVHS
jgi:hypothetical protein